jgi:two-component system KDP operon response regulator KdpE
MSAPHPLVLVVEDNRQMREVLRETLDIEGYRVMDAGTVAEGLSEVTTRHPDAVLVDRGLPDGDGLDLVRRVREWSSVPVIVVSAHDREEDKVAALDAGADDYLAKPFGTMELLARLRVALRHSRAATLPKNPVVEVGALRVDLVRRETTMEGRPVVLTPTEWRLMAYLARHVGKVLTSAQILKEVWGPNATSHGHYVRICVAALRKKLEPDPSQPRFLLSEYGVGYRLADERSPIERH